MARSCCERPLKGRCENKATDSDVAELINPPMESSFGSGLLSVTKYIFGGAGEIANAVATPHWN